MSEQRSGPVSVPAAAAAAAAGAVTGADHRSQSGGDSSQNESEGESTDNGREFAPVKEAEFPKPKVIRLRNSASQKNQTVSDKT